MTTKNGSQSTKQAWAKRAVHTVTCPTGFQVKVRFPDLGLLLKGDALPDTLRAAALRELSSDDTAVTIAPAENGNGGEHSAEEQEAQIERIRDAYELHQWLVTQTVVDPVLEIADLEELPQEDLAMLTQIATRQRNRDAKGVRLGVEPLNEWERFRHHHGCPDEGCEGCEALVKEFSTADVGAV